MLLDNQLKKLYWTHMGLALLLAAGVVFLVLAIPHPNTHATVELVFIDTTTTILGALLGYIILRSSIASNNPSQNKQRIPFIGIAGIAILASSFFLPLPAVAVGCAMVMANVLVLITTRTRKQARRVSDAQFVRSFAASVISLALLPIILDTGRALIPIPPLTFILILGSYLVLLAAMIVAPALRKSADA